MDFSSPKMFVRFGVFGTTLVKNGQEQQQRGMATLKAISIRLKSVKNIQKITQSMKMVSAAKYARAERELKAVRPIGSGASQFYEKAEIQPVADVPQKLIVAMTSDRGNLITVKSVGHREIIHWCRVGHDITLHLHSLVVSLLHKFIYDCHFGISSLPVF